MTIPPVDPMTQPLPVAPPPTWRGREDRCAWVDHNLTPGEKSLLFRIWFDSQRMRRGTCLMIERQEKKTLEEKK